MHSRTWKIGLVTAVAAASVGGVAATTSATGDEVPPGAQNEAARVGNEIDALRTSGLSDDDPKLQMLKSERDRLLAETKASTATVDEPPVPAADDPLQDNSMDRGLIPCEPSPPYTDGVDLKGARCVSVPTSPGAGLYVYLLPRGRAFVIHVGDGTDRSQAAAFQNIPAMPELGNSAIDVDHEGHVVVETLSGATTSLDTANW